MLQNHFFANFRKLQKKLPICKKKYAEILNVDRSVVTHVERKQKRIGRNFFGSHLEEQSVVFPVMVKGVCQICRFDRLQKYCVWRKFFVILNLKISWFCVTFSPRTPYLMSSLRVKIYFIVCILVLREFRLNRNDFTTSSISSSNVKFFAVVSKSPVFTS